MGARALGRAGVAQLSQLNRLREQGGIQEALLVTGNGQLIGASGSQLSELVPEVPSQHELRQARTQRMFATIEGEAGAVEARQGLRARVIVPIPAPASLVATQRVFGDIGDACATTPRPDRLSPASSRPSETRFLQLIQPVPPSIAANAEALQNGYREYQELSLARRGCRRSTA